MESMQTKRKGEGRVYTDKRTGLYIVEWYVSGKRFREYTHSRDERIARTTLIQRVADRDKGITYNPIAQHCKFREIAADLVREYEMNNRRTTEQLKLKINRFLNPYFGNIKANQITPAHIQKYKEMRLRKVTTATVNHDLAILQMILNFGIQNRKVIAANVPIIKRFKKTKPRETFYEWREAVLLSQHLPEHLKNLPLIYFLTGWRYREVLTLEWGRVDFVNYMMRLTADLTKNEKPKFFPFAPASMIAKILNEQREYTDRVQRERSVIVSLVFHREGFPLKDFRRAWKIAHEEAKLPYRTIHDLRRSAKRAYEMSGASEHFSMKLMGHSSVQITRDYAIADVVALRKTTDQMEKFIQAQTDATASHTHQCPLCGHLHRDSSAPQAEPDESISNDRGQS